MDIGPVAAAYGAKPFDSTVKNGKKAAPEKTAAAQSEQVELSNESIRMQKVSMQKLNEIIESTPNVRIKVVEEIRTKIKYNGYPLESNIYKAIQNMVSEKIL